MTELEKLTGGRRPFFINAADGLIQNKKFFLLLVARIPNLAHWRVEPQKMNLQHLTWPEKQFLVVCQSTVMEMLFLTKYKLAAA